MYMKTRNILIQKLKRQPSQGFTLKPPNPATFINVITDIQKAFSDFKIGADALAKNMHGYFYAVQNNVSDTLDVGITNLDTFKLKFRTITKDHKAAMNSINESFANSQAITNFQKQSSDLNKEMIVSIQNNTFLERRNSSLNKSFGVTSKGAAALGDRFLYVAKAINGVTEANIENKDVSAGLGAQYAINSLQIGQYAASLQKLMPLLDQSLESKPDKKNNDYLANLYRSQAVLQTSLGLSEELSMTFEEQATFSGVSSLNQLAALDEFAKGFDPNGTAGVYKGIVSDIASLTSDISIHYAKHPLQLAKSVMKMKQLGLSMADLYKTGNDLLNIESSIENELTYQLISGNRLVDLQGESLTNKFREAHLSGKTEDAAEAMNQILSQESETLKNSLFARQEMSKLLGITEQQVASAIAKKEILDAAAEAGVIIKLDGSEQSMKAAEDLLKAGEITATQFEALLESQDTRTTEDIAKESLTALQELVLLESGMINKDHVMAARKGSLDQATSLDNALSIRVAEYMKSQQDAYNKMTLLERTRNVTLEDQGKIDNLGKKTDLTVNETQDAIIPPGNGSRILSFPEDKLQPSIAFNDKDTITASTQAPTYASTMPPTPESDTANPMLLITDILNKLLSKSPTTTTTATTADSGQYIMQVGKMIVAELQNQTGQLKPKPIDNTYGVGLNAPLFSGKL